MKKKIVALLVVVILAATMLVPAVAEARGYSPSVVNRNYRLVSSMVERANRQIDALVFIAKITPYDDVDWLLWQTNSIANRTIATAWLLGYDVECVYVYHVIDGRRVAIDPLYVVNPLPDSGDGK